MEGMNRRCLSRWGQAGKWWVWRGASTLGCVWMDGGKYAFQDPRNEGKLEEKGGRGGFVVAERRKANLLWLMYI